jgi:hypothetical protein
VKSGSLQLSSDNENTLEPLFDDGMKVSSDCSLMSGDGVSRSLTVASLFPFPVRNRITEEVELETLEFRLGNIDCMEANSDRTLKSPIGSSDPES